MNQQIIESLLNRISALERRQAEMTLNAVQPRHNLAAGAAPLVTDDITLGYSAGSVWIFGTDIYICSSGAAGAAVWDIVNGGSFGGDVDDLTTNTGVAGQMVRVAGAGGLEYRNPSDVRTDIGATTIGGNVFTSANPSAISFGRANADNTFSWLSASAFRTAIGGTTIGSNVFTSTNPSAITFARANADNSLSWLSASAFRTAIGATTVGGNFFTATNPSAVTFVRVNADNTVSFLSAANFITALNLDGLYVTLGTTQTISGFKNFTSKIGLGTATPLAEIDNRAFDFGDTFATATKVFNVTFANGVADQKFDLYMTGSQEIVGVLEVELTSTAQFAFALGGLKKIYWLGVVAGGTIFQNEARYAEVSGTTPDNFAISDLSWDAANSRYKITIVHRVSAGNPVTVRMRILGESGTSTTRNNFLTMTAGAIYTTDTTVYARPEISYLGSVSVPDEAYASGWNASLQVPTKNAIYDKIESLPTQLVVMFHAESDGTITLTNQPNTAQFLSNSNRNIWQVDLTKYTQVRIVARVTTGSASANSPRLIARYKTVASGFSTTVGDYVDIGTSEVSASLTSTGVIASSWIAITASALADIFITIIQNGGDGAADPAYAMLGLQFR